MKTTKNGLEVILIDPWGTANTSEYLNGLIYGLAPITHLKVFTNHYFKLKTPSRATIHYVFFRFTEKIPHNIFRKALRGIEYIIGYHKIIKFLRKNGSVDIIHINWLLNYKLDILFLRELKKYTKKIVYTAHNVLPHINGKKSLAQLKKVYSLCDQIILHGENIRNEFEKYFPTESHKIYIQKHGCNLHPDISYDEKEIEDGLKCKVNLFEKRYIFFGRIFWNKGLDRLVSAWHDDWNDTLLIIAGKIDDYYPELNQYREQIANATNILLLDEYVEDNTLNYLIDKSDIIVLPYRHASMSGVVFTAADFKKTILCTDVGALPEYLCNNDDSFIVDNTDAAIRIKLNYIHDYISKEQLLKMGVNLSINITSKYSWNIVADKLLAECYLK